MLPQVHLIICYTDLLYLGDKLLINIFSIVEIKVTTVGLEPIGLFITLDNPNFESAISPYIKYSYIPFN